MTKAAQPLRDALELVRRAPAGLWPGFVLEAIPTLVFDGESTWLGGAPPEEPGWAETPDGWWWTGRYPALVANTAVTLPGVTVASGVLLPDLGAVPAQRLAGLLVHEAFHVWQAANPSSAWEANELDALSYPAGDAEVLHARAEETAALSAALAQPDWKGAAARALAWRAVRHALLSDGQRRYEQRTETLEGLAHFVESRFLNEFPPLDPLAAVRLGVRQWAYLSGAAYAYLLSRGAETWQTEVMLGKPLDGILAGQINPSTRTPSATPALAEAAAHAARAHTLRLERLRQAFDALPGKRLRLSGGHLRVVGFDPLNVHALPGRQVLHTRYVSVEVGDGRMEIMGAQALAEGSRLLTPTALSIASVPEPRLGGGRWRIESERLHADFAAASVQATSYGWEISVDE